MKSNHAFVDGALLCECGYRIHYPYQFNNADNRIAETVHCIRCDRQYEIHIRLQIIDRGRIVNPADPDADFEDMLSELNQIEGVTAMGMNSFMPDIQPDQLIDKDGPPYPDEPIIQDLDGLGEPPHDFERLESVNAVVLSEEQFIHFLNTGELPDAETLQANLDNAEDVPDLAALGHMLYSMNPHAATLGQEGEPQRVWDEETFRQHVADNPDVFFSEPEQPYMPSPEDENLSEAEAVKSAYNVGTISIEEYQDYLTTGNVPRRLHL